MSLGSILRQKREELGYTLDEVSNRIGFSKPCLSTIETGKAKNPPSDEVLTKLEKRISHRRCPELAQALSEVEGGKRKKLQMVDQIKYGIASGRLLPGEQLPTVRELAVHLQVNPNTVRKGYSELEILGILDTQQGTGTFVGQKEVEIAETEKERMLEQICSELVARGNQYGFTLEEIVAHLQRRIENGG